MILAAAQTKPKRGDIRANLADHCNLTDLASKNGARLIVFPEMSITGYERERAKGLAFTENDSRLDELKELSAERQIIIVAGAPVILREELFIGAFILKPDRSVAIYTKQFLHAGEEFFFSPSADNNPIIALGRERCSVAICADIDNPSHPEKAKKAGTTVYLSSLFFTPNGIPTAYRALSGYAQKHGMNVLMANFCGQSWDNCTAGGDSGFWDSAGKLIARQNSVDPGLLVVEKIDGQWFGKSPIYE
jgi:predicted amidohydrolase